MTAALSARAESGEREYDRSARTASAGEREYDRSPPTLSLEASLIRGKSVFETAFATAPLRLLFPRSPRSGAAVACVTNYGGGFVDRDEVSMRARIGPDASVVLTTQAQTKVHRSPNGCGQSWTISVAAGGLLVSAPDPLVPYRGARWTQRASIHLDEGASLLWLETVHAGRRAHGERWAFSRFASRLDVRVGNAYLLRDAQRFEAAPEPFAISSRMKPFDAIASVVALGPRAVVAPLRLAEGDGVAATALLPGGSFTRAMASDPRRLAAALQASLSPTAEAIGWPLVRKR